MRLRELRSLEGLAPDAFAAALGVPAALYEQYEAGAVDIPAGVLHEAARELKVDLTELLTGEAPRMKVFTVTRRGGGVAVERTKSYQYRSLAANFRNRKADVFEVTVPPDDAPEPDPGNAHPGQEFTYMLEGRMAVEIHGHVLVLEEGDSLYFDSTCCHAMRALDGKPARFLAVIL